jgi:nucleotide-binding universal stress UspA family protein
MAFSKILIAVDGSEYSLNAAKKGFALAHQLEAMTALVFVVDVARTIHSADTGILPDEAVVVLKKEAEQTLDQIASLYDGKDLFKFMPEGHPVEDIIKTAEAWEADLIIMGTHARTGLIHLLRGSVAESVLHRSKTPVLIVPLK